MEISPCIVLTGSYLDMSSAKTAHALVRGSARFKVVAVVDARLAGSDAGIYAAAAPCGVPVVRTVEEAVATAHCTHCVIGVAISGGELPPALIHDIHSAIDHNLHIVNGLHKHLSTITSIRERAQQKGVSLIDIRKSKPFEELSFWSGEIFSVKAPRLALLGTDCAVGKRTTATAILDACKGWNIHAEMIYTGQTGWMLGYPYGFLFDTTVNDFVSGELEKAIVTCDREASPDLILLEGQSALRNPSGPCGSELLLSAHCQKVVLQHALGRIYFKGNTKIKIPPVEDEFALIRHFGADVIAISLNLHESSLENGKSEQRRLEKLLGIPVVLPREEGLEPIRSCIEMIVGTGAVR